MKRPRKCALTRGVRAVVQRVSEAGVIVEGNLTGAIAQGLCVLLGVGTADTAEDARWMAGKIVELRIFEDEQGKMNRSLIEVKGAMLAISQFTLYGDARQGRRALRWVDTGASGTEGSGTT